jgi:beta-galactosidase
VTLDKKSYGCDLWSDLIELDGAEAIATYEEDFRAGLPAVARHRFGEGTSYYLGTRPEESYMVALLDRACTQAGVTATLTTPAGVEVVRREGGGRSFLFALNHRSKPTELRLPSTARDLLTGEDWEGQGTPCAPAARRSRPRGGADGTPRPRHTRRSGHSGLVTKVCIPSAPVNVSY